MRPIAILPKPAADDAKYCYQSAIENGVKTTDLVDRALDAKITISTRELLAASSDVRQHVKEAVTSRKISANVVEVDEVDAYLTGCFEDEPKEVFVDLEKYESGASVVASLPLRVIYPTFAPSVNPKCVLDGGAQVVIMRKDIWERLQIPISQNHTMPMESANSSTTMTLGLVENFPVQLGPVTVYLQIQVVEDAPFEVLLGRPFFDITSCSEVSTAGGKHIIHIKDPKTGKPYVLATEPRLCKSHKLNSESTRPDSGVNFRR